MVRIVSLLARVPDQTEMGLRQLILLLLRSHMETPFSYGVGPIEKTIVVLAVRMLVFVSKNQLPSKHIIMKR